MRISDWSSDVCSSDLKNPQSTLKLGHARGAALVALARTGTEVGEYSAKIVKKSIVGTGNAEKQQVQAMIGRLLPGAKITGADAADALAVALSHAHHLASPRTLQGATARSQPSRDRTTPAPGTRLPAPPHPPAP